MLREAGATVGRNQKLADMRLPGVHASDKRKIEIVAKHLPLYRGLPLVLDATIVSPLRANGQPRPRAAVIDGVAITAIENDKHTKYPELTHSSECKFLVLADEIGGRWSETSNKLIRDLARVKSRSAAPRLRRSMAFAWENRWWGMLSIALQDILAATLVDDAPRMLHAWEGTGPPLGVLLHGEALAISRVMLH